MKGRVSAPLRFAISLVRLTCTSLLHDDLACSFNDAQLSDALVVGDALYFLVESRTINRLVVFMTRGDTVQVIDTLNLPGSGTAHGCCMQYHPEFEVSPFNAMMARRKAEWGPLNC